MKLKLLPVVALVALSQVAQAQTLADYSQGVAEVKMQIQEVRSARELGVLLAEYQSAAFSDCKVKFAIKRGVQSAVTPFRFLRDFSWGVIIGKEVIRKQYGIEGHWFSDSVTIAKGGVVATFEEINRSTHGEYGSCTLRLEQVRLIEEALESANVPAQPIINVRPDTDLPLIIVPSVDGQKKH